MNGITNFKTTSVVSYPARDNRYGKNTYRGNCTGLLIKDMIEFLNQDYLLMHVKEVKLQEMYAKKWVLIM